MKTPSIITAVVLVSLATAAPVQKVDTTGCGEEWMPVENVKTNHDKIARQGFNSAIESFCDAANGVSVGNEYLLSMAKRVWLDYGGDPKTTGINGYVYFEFHNTKGSDHVVEGDKCKEYLKTFSSDGHRCRNGKSNKHGDTKGGTYTSDEGTWRAVGNKVVPGSDAVDQLVNKQVPIVPLGNGNKGKTIDPFPLYAFDDVLPIPCHSHNDYTRDTALYSALLAGCISVEADVRPQDGQLIVGHTDAENAGTLEDLYLKPLKQLLDEHRNIFPAAEGQGFSLLIDFKGDADETWDLLIEKLKPLREGSTLGYPYLSYWDDEKGFQDGWITVIASGSAIIDGDVAKPIAKVRDNNPGRAIFADARINKDMSKFDRSNAYFASANFNDVLDGGLGGIADSDKEKLKAQIDAAHAEDKMFKVRYWDIPADPRVWQQLIDLGVDKINVDNLQDVASLDFTTGKILP